MKQAKFALTVVVIFAIAGGALAFKSSRSFKVFYTLYITTVGGIRVVGCVGTIYLSYAPDPGGTILTNASSATLIPATTCKCTVRLNG